MIESQKSAPHGEREGARKHIMQANYRDGMIGRIMSYSDTGPERARHKSGGFAWLYVLESMSKATEPRPRERERGFSLT